MRFVRIDKDYLGKAARRWTPIHCWVCAYLSIEPDGEIDGHGGEAVMLDGQTVGSTASVAYGHTVGKILAFAYLKPEAAARHRAGGGHPRHPAPARVLGEPAYDPQSLCPAPMPWRTRGMSLPDTMRAMVTMGHGDLDQIVLHPDWPRPDPAPARC
jgi:dimethylglycine dehydrogenase